MTGALVFTVQLIVTPTEPGQPSRLDREFAYSTRSEAEQLAEAWRRIQGVRDGRLLVRVVTREARITGTRPR